MDALLNWHAVYTMPCREKRVAHLLDLKNIENYCPLQKAHRQWKDRKKIIYDPLFRSYVFIRISKKEAIPVLETEGVLNIVSFLGKPAVVRDEEIALIRQFLNEYKEVQVQQLDLQVNDRIKINEGPLRQQEGIVTEVKSRSVKVILPSLGFAMTAETGISNIEKVTPVKH